MTSSEITQSLLVHVQGQERHPIRFENGKPLVLPLILGETVALPAGITAITEVAIPGGATAEPDEDFRTLQLSAVGRYHLRANTAADVLVDLSFCVCEQAAHDWIPTHRGINQQGSEIERRLVLRSLATYHLPFDGTRAALMPLNLGLYGA
jgi:hypothetical protein